MKKTLALLVAVMMLICGAQAASAAELPEEPVAAARTSVSYKLVSTLNIKQGTMLLYPYNLSPSTTASYMLKNETKNKSETYYFKDFYNRPKSIGISSADTYTPYMGTGSSLGGGGSFTYNDTGCKYDIIKVRLSDLITDLNKDGSYTKYVSPLNANYTYRFTEQTEPNGDRFYSALFFESGAAVTCVTPDKNGEAEIVVSRNPAHSVSYSTGFSFNIVSTGGLVSGGGGGKNRGNVSGLRMGDVNMDGYVDISDVTFLQRLLSEYERTGSLSTRNGDMDRDKSISINDATIMQRYLAEYDISEYYK